MLRKVVLAVPLVLGACAATPTNEMNAAACVGALMATGSKEASVIVGAALASPACQALTAEALKQMIVNVEQSRLK